MDFITIRQSDYSGGVNLMDDPIELKENEIADCRNIRLKSKNKIVQRKGYTEYNGTTIGASTEVRSLFHFLGFDETWIPLAQAGNNLYKGNTAFPGTGGSWSSIFTGSAGADQASIDAMWGRLIYTDYNAVPKLWEGNYGKCFGFKKTVDAGANYTDYFSEVTDNSTATHAALDALDTAANNDYVLIRSRVPKITGIRFEMGSNVNTNASDLAIHYWDGDSWEAVSALDDTTDVVATKTLSGTGNASFTEATTVMQTIEGSPGYYWRVSVSAALSATVDVTQCKLIYNIQDLPSLWDGSYEIPAGVKASSDTLVTFKDWTIKTTDSSLSTVATLGAYTVTTGALIVQHTQKFNTIQIQMSNVNINTNAVTLTATYWTGAAWAALTIVDGTSANSKTLAQSGLITFAVPSTWVKNKIGNDEIPTYQVKLVFGAALSTNVDVAEVRVAEEPEALKVFKLCCYHKNRAFLLCRKDAKNYLFYSAQFLPDTWMGPDTGYIGLPSGKEITAVGRFFNELFIATADEIYLLEGYTPSTFGLLRINTGGIGVVARHSVVPVGRYIYFAHSTGFYRFDGAGVVLISGKIQKMFDENEATWLIPKARLEYIQGRYNRTEDGVEFTVSKGSTATTNNMITLFNVNEECWFFDDIVAASLLRTTGSSYQDIFYHGDYVGDVHRDLSGTSDNGTAVDAYVITKGFRLRDYPHNLLSFRGLQSLLDVQSAGSLTVTYATGGASSFSSLGTLLMTRSGYSHTRPEIWTDIPCTSIQLKIQQATKDYTFGLTDLSLYLTLARELEVQL